MRATATPFDQHAGVHVLRTSCDACKYRKVKCDRRAKLQEHIDRLAEQNDVLTEEAAEDVVCSSCAAYGVRCTFATSTRKAAPRKPAKGRSYDSSSGPSSSSLSTPSTSKLSSSSSRSGSTPSSSPPSERRTADGLLGVKGLTRQCLDACTEAYLCYAAHCLAILDIDVFRSRYSRAMGEVDGPVTLRPPCCGDPKEAASTVLMLAVGCVGAGLLDEDYYEDKFKLQQRFALRFKEVVDEETRQETPSLDVIEAVFIITDLQLDMIDNRDPLDAQDLNHPASSLSSLLRLSPASHEAVVRLAIRLGINRRPAPVHAGSDIWKTVTGQVISESEALRRVRIFWAVSEDEHSRTLTSADGQTRLKVFAHDTFRALGTRRPPLITGEDYDHELPRWSERPDGDFDIDFFGHGQTLNVPRLDALYLEAAIKLSFAMRPTIAPMVSMRARARGICAEDILRTVKSMQEWRASLPVELLWECQGHSLFKAMVCDMGILKAGTPWPKLSRAPPEMIGKAIKVLFLETIYMAQLLGTWTAFDEFGVRDEGDVTDMAKTLDELGITQPQITASDASRLALTTTQSLSVVTKDPPAKAAKEQLFEIVLANLYRTTQLQTEAAALGLLRANRCVFASLGSAYCILACRLAVAKSKEGKIVSEDQRRNGRDSDLDIDNQQDPMVLLSQAQRLVSEAIATCDSLADRDKIVMQLQAVIDKTRASLKVASPTVSSHHSNIGVEINSAIASTVVPAATTMDKNAFGAMEHGGMLHMRRILRAMDRDEQEDMRKQLQSQQQEQQQPQQQQQPPASRPPPELEDVRQPPPSQQYTLPHERPDSVPMELTNYTTLDILS